MPWFFGPVALMRTVVGMWLFGGAPWQSCQFHLQKNAGAYVNSQELRAAIAADIGVIL